MADTQGFRAVRYTGAAGRLADLVAPPYDAVSPAERARLYTRSPYNVVHVTLPETVEEAGRLWRDWLAQGIVAREETPSTWRLVEEYVGPDRVPRTRHGVVVSLRAEPYAAGQVLPHERTDPGVREDRRRLLEATGVQPEPILALASEPLAGAVPESVPDLEVDGSRLWRLEDADSSSLAGGELLIADGHHRYESAVELAPALRSGEARIMALVVSIDDPGLHVFPTHRVFSGRPDLAALREGEVYGSLDDALAHLAASPIERAAAVAFRRGRVELLQGRADELDVELVDRHGLEGIGYTTREDEAVAAVERGEADVAFLVRAPRVEDVFAVARRGERMPPKSTYFFPKPLAGLLFHPVEP